MDKEFLKRHVQAFINHLEKEGHLAIEQQSERLASVNYYQGWTKDRILRMNADEAYEYISKLWAMLIWGNKHYVVNKMLDKHGIEIFRKELAEFVWGSETIDKRWDNFRKKIVGMGPAMMSEILCKTHPNEFMIWNRRAYNGLNLLGVKNLPVYNYQMTGKKYAELSNKTKEIAIELENAGFIDPTLLAADYFLWHEFYADNLNDVFKKESIKEEPPITKTEEDDEFIHNDVRDAIRDIGRWLGFNADTEIKVADGSVVDTVWEATIGNMGRVVYVFEVQTKGSIDSLILNLLKARNNPAVQSIVAVSDAKQIEKIKKHSASVPGLSDKLKFWDYKEVWKVHESLEFAYGAINNLKLVPDSF